MTERVQILVGLLILACINLVFAAAPDIIWHKTYIHWGDDKAFDVQPSLDGGFVVAGETDGPATSSELWVFKVDSGGDTLWNYYYGSADWDGARAIDLAWDGSYVVAGFIGGYAQGDFTWFKVSDSGVRGWEEQWDAGAHDVLYDIHQTSEQEYIMTGTSGPRDSLGLLYLIKTDSEGKIVWQVTSGGGSTGKAGRSVVEAGDFFFVAGERMSGSADQGDMTLFTCSKDSTETSSFNYGDVSSWEKGFGIARAPNGGFVLAGSLGGPAGSEEGDDVYLLKLDSAMNVVWERRYGLYGFDDRASSVERIFSGGYLVTGTTSSFGANRDVWVLRINEEGDTLWTLVWDTGADDIGNAGYPTDDGFIIAGNREVGAASSAFLLRLGEEKPGVTEPSAPQSPDLAVSYRSGSLFINYTLHHRAKINLSVFDAAGRKVTELLDTHKSPGSYSLNRNVSHLSPGVYFVRMASDDQSSTAQIVVTP